MIVLTPTLAAKMLDVWSARQQMLPADRARCVGSVRDAAVRAQTPPETRQHPGYGFKKPNWKHVA